LRFALSESPGAERRLKGWGGGATRFSGSVASKMLDVAAVRRLRLKLSPEAMPFRRVVPSTMRCYSQAELVFYVLFSVLVF